MTHITIEREKLEQVLEALLINCGGNTEGIGKETIATIKQALAAPVQPMAHIVGEIDHAGKVWKPAQRPWVGLTHDEYDAVCDKHSAMSDFDFLEDIEAKLKERNQ